MQDRIIDLAEQIIAARRGELALTSASKEATHAVPAVAATPVAADPADTLAEVPTHAPTKTRWKLSKRSLKNMLGLHPHLRKVIEEALSVSPHDFVVTCGLRTVEEQAALLRQGRTTTMNSRHLTGHAFDIAVIVDDAVVWDMPAYATVAKCFKEIAAKFGIALEWGGDWRNFPDGPHFQLSWDAHSKNEAF